MTSAIIRVMKTMAVAKFKEQCLAIVDRLSPEGIIITKRGRPVARLLPIERSSAELIGCLEGRIHVTGDIVSTGVSGDSLA